MTQLFNGISWGTYLTVLAILVAAYYIIIGALYYKKEFRSLLSGKGKSSKANEQDEEEQGDSLFDELEEVVLDIRSNILEQAGKSVGKADLLDQLKERLTTYGGLRNPAFRVAVDNFIIKHAEEICGVVYSEEELEAAWGILPR